MILSNIKVRIKIGSNEIEIESPLQLMNDVIDLIPRVTEKMNWNNNIPSITIDKNDSLNDVILKLFKDDWGNNARRLSDVKSMLESYGLSYPKQSIAVALMRLAQSGKLRRFKNDNNEYVYTASIKLSNPGEKHG